MTPENEVLWSIGNACDRSIAARVAIAGDFLPCGRLLLNDHGNWAEMAAPIAAHFNDVDATIANLECALDAEGLSPRPLDGIGDIVSAPSASLDYLAAIRARAVGIANNHSSDFGEHGIRRTRDAISSTALVPLGAARTLQSPPETYIWQGPGGIRVGFWCAAKATHNPATDETCGVEPATLQRASAAFHRLREQGAQFSIALLHAGCLRTNRPEPEDVALLNSIARAGFNVVAGSHSHRISGACRIDRASSSPSFVFYGLGSIVSGFITSPIEREGLIVVTSFDSHTNLRQIEVRPVWIGESGFGAVPPPEISQSILKRFNLLSGEIRDGSYERLFYRDISAGLMHLHIRDVRAAFRQGGIRALARKAARLRMRHVRRLVRKVTG